MGDGNAPVDARSSRAAESVAESARRRLDKIALRRDELARAAFKTLATSGYAGTSIRDIGANSDYSYGVLHYYFADKVDLITHCVRLYKAECVTKYDGLVDTATAADTLHAEFAARLARTMAEDHDMHVLWYDLRNQSMFESAFVDEVRAIDAALERMIWRVVERYAELGGTRPRVDSPTAYAAFDGVFAKALVDWAHGDRAAEARLRLQAFDLLPCLVEPRRG